MEVGAAKYHACRLSALPVAMSARTYTRGHGPEQAAVNRLTGLECINYTYCVSLAFVAVRTFSCTVGAWASEGTLVQVGRGQGRQGLHSSVKSRMLPALEFGARSSPAGRLAVFSGRRALRSPRAQRPEALSSCGSHVPRPPMPVGSGAAGRWYSASLSISVPPGPAADSGCVTAERPAGHSCHTAWMQQRRAHDSNQVNRDPDRYLVAPRPHLLDSWTDFNEHARLAADHPLAEPVGRPDHRKVRLTRWWPVVAPVVILAIGLSLLSPAGRHQWALSIFRQPTHYTTLSFNHAWELPATIQKGIAIPVSFTVSNQEGRIERYRYVLSEANSGGDFRVLASSQDILRSGASWIVHTRITPTCARSPCQIKVTLPGYPEEIDFLLTLKTKAN